MFQDKYCPYCKAVTIRHCFEDINYFEVSREKIPPPRFGKDLNLYNEKRVEVCQFEGKLFLECQNCGSFWEYSYQAPYSEFDKAKESWCEISKETYLEFAREWEAAKMKPGAEIRK